MFSTLFIAGVLVFGTERTSGLQQQTDLTAEQRYKDQISKASRAWADFDIDAAKTALATCTPRPGQPDLRAWEWHYLNTLVRGSSLRLLARERLAAAAWSPNGRLIACLLTNSIKIYDAETLREQSSFTLESPVDSTKRHYLTWSPDSAYLASDEAAYHVATGKVTYRFSSHPNRNRPLAWSSDSRFFATVAAQTQRAVKIDVMSGKEVLTLRALPDEWVSTMPDPIMVAALSPDGKAIAMRLQGGRLILWDARTGEQSFCLPSRGNLLHVCWKPDSQELATVTKTDSLKFKVQIWNLAKRRSRLSWDGVTSAPADPILWWSADGQRLSFGDPTQTVWDADFGGLLFENRQEEASKFCARVDSQARHVIDTRSGKVTLLDQNQEVISFFDIRPRGLMPAAWSPEGGRLLLATFGPGANKDSDPKILVWMLPKKDVRGSSWPLGSLIEAPAESAELSWSPDGKHFLVDKHLGDPEQETWRTLANAGATTLSRQVVRASTMGMLAPGPDGERLAVSYGDGTIRVFNRAGESLLLGRPSIYPDWSITPHRAIVWSGSGHALAVPYNDGHIDVWNIPKGDLRCRIEVPSKPADIGSHPICTWSSDERYLAISKLRSDTVWLFDAKTGDATEVVFSPERRSGPPTEEIFQLAWRPRAKEIAIGFSGRVVLWNPETGAKAEIRPDSDRYSGPFLWSPDGQILITGVTRASSGIRLWYARDGSFGTCRFSSDSIFGQQRLTCAWKPDGKQLIACDATGHCKVFDAKSATELSSQSSLLLAGSTSTFLAQRGPAVQAPPRAPLCRPAMIWSEHGPEAVLALRDRLEIWQPVAAKKLRQINVKARAGLATVSDEPPSADQLAAHAWSKDGRRLAVLRLGPNRPVPENARGRDRWGLPFPEIEDCTLSLFESSSGNSIWNLGLHDVDWMPGPGYSFWESSMWHPDLPVDWEPSGKRLAVAAVDCIQIVDASNGNKLIQLQEASIWTKDEPAPEAKPAERKLLPPDAATTKVIRPLGPMLQRHGKIRVGLAMAWSPNGNRLVAAAAHPSGMVSVVIWDTNSGKRLRSHQFMSDSAFRDDDDFRIAWEPTGSCYATCSAKEIRVFNADSGEEAFALKNSLRTYPSKVTTARIAQFGWSRDRQRLTLVTRNTVHVPREGIWVEEIQATAWDPNRHELVANFVAPQGTVPSPDGKWIFTGLAIKRVD
jgi:WD40 repeat protein